MCGESSPTESRTEKSYTIITITFSYCSFCIQARTKISPTIRDSPSVTVCMAKYLCSMDFCYRILHLYKLDFEYHFVNFIRASYKSIRTTDLHSFFWDQSLVWIVSITKFNIQIVTWLLFKFDRKFSHEYTNFCIFFRKPFILSYRLSETRKIPAK